MNLILAIPVFLRLLWVFIVGTCIGSFINVCIFRLPEYESVVRGGSRCLGCQAPIRWFDNIPLVSWLRLRGKCRNCGAAISWQYPLVELATGLLFAWLYWWEVIEQGLLPTAAPAGGPMILPAGLNLDWLLHGLFLAHVILVAFMVASTVIDMRYQVIPDEFTIPGTLCALILIAAWPWALPPHIPLRWPGAPPAELEFLVLTHDQLLWPGWLDGSPSRHSLVIALGCLLAWCAALLPWSWRSSRGWGIAAAILCRDLTQERWRYVVAVLGSIAIWLCWRYLPQDNWRGLLSALVGMVWGGGYTWLIRIMARVGLGKEALGFGDVILMAMFGAFLGWQGVTIAFFMAPFFGLFVAVGQFVILRETRIPYGPSLCVGALAVVIWWQAAWDAARATFVVFGWLLPALLLGSTLLLAFMLLIYRGIKFLAGFDEDDEDEEEEQEEEAK